MEAEKEEPNFTKKPKPGKKERREHDSTRSMEGCCHSCDTML